MGSPTNPDLEPTRQNGQTEIPDIDERKAEVRRRVELIGEAAVSRLVDPIAERYRAENVTYTDMAIYAAEHGRTRAEAGKMFSRFYRGLQDMGIEIPKNRPSSNYQKSRDGISYPLVLLTEVVDRQDQSTADFYDTMLKDYHNRKMEAVLVKQSTST